MQIPMKDWAGRPSAVISGTLTLWLAMFSPFQGRAADARAAGTLSLQVNSAATMAVVPAGSQVDAQSGNSVSWFALEIAVRINQGATITLFLQPPSGKAGSGETTASHLLHSVAWSDAALGNLTAGTRPEVVFTTAKSGAYSLTVGVSSSRLAPAGDSSQEPVFFDLRSSDGAVHLSHTIQGIGPASSPEKENLPVRLSNFPK